MLSPMQQYEEIAVKTINTASRIKNTTTVTTSDTYTNNNKDVAVTYALNAYGTSGTPLSKVYINNIEVDGVGGQPNVRFVKYGMILLKKGDTFKIDGNASYACSYTVYDVK